jgi:hypothetical protein
VRLQRQLLSWSVLLWQRQLDQLLPLLLPCCSRQPLLL